VIFSRIGPASEVIEDGVTGLLVDPYDQEDIAEKVMTILANADMAKLLASRARETARRRFAAAKCIELSLDFYARCRGGSE
jgi:glycosyltransferase involved in cell wall biosynthesis